MHRAVGWMIAGSFCLVWAQEMPTFRVPVRLVSVAALVFNKDSRLVTGLRATSFRLTHNGAPQVVTVDPIAAPLSVALVIQANLDVRTYVPFISRVGSVVDALLTGETGEAALLTYADAV